MNPNDVVVISSSSEEEEDDVVLISDDDCSESDAGEDDYDVIEVMESDDEDIPLDDVPRGSDTQGLNFSLDFLYS